MDTHPTAPQLCEDIAEAGAQLAVWWLFELDAIGDDRRKLFEERAAVREYEAGFPRAVAELVALADIPTSTSDGNKSRLNGAPRLWPRD